MTITGLPPVLSSVISEGRVSEGKEEKRREEGGRRRREERLIPSMQVSNCDTILLSISRLEFPLFGVMASTSSIKIRAGEFWPASSKIRRIFASDSPETPETISGAESLKKGTPSSPAIAEDDQFFGKIETGRMEER
jgi:hypothetical protein